MRKIFKPIWRVLEFLLVTALAIALTFFALLLMLRKIVVRSSARKDTDWETRKAPDKDLSKSSRQY